MRLKSQQIVLYCLGLHTQNPGLREVDLEPSRKRGSDKIKMLRQERKIQEKSMLYHTVWTHSTLFPANKTLDFCLLFIFSSHLLYYSMFAWSGLTQRKAILTGLANYKIAALVFFLQFQ